MKLFSFVVTPYLISGRNLNRVIGLHAYQNIEYHRYHYDVIFFWHSDQGVRDISCPNIIHKSLTLETNMHILYTKASFFHIYQFKCEKIFVQFFGTA